MQTQADARSSRLVFPVFTLALVFMGGGVYAAYRLQRSYTISRAESIASRWSENPRMLSGLMIERYGPPDVVRSDVMIWFKRPPWKRVVVHEDERRGPLEQVVAVDVDPRKADAVAAFGRGVFADPMSSELAAQGPSESRNFLALNLADEIVAGARSPEDARGFYDRTLQLAAAGKSSGYTAGLLFEPSGAKPLTWVKDAPF